MARVAINGLGRIGRAALKILLETPDMEVTAVNDLTPVENLAYLLKFDSVYGRYEGKVEAREGALSVNNRRIETFNEKDPARLPWRKLEVDLVFECTGAFTRMEDMKKHLQAGAGKVLLSAPSKDPEVVTVVYGVNSTRKNDSKFVSCASCTTNCITPVIEIAGRRIGVKKAIMTTLHAYTSSQALVDGPNKKFTRGRAAGVNLVPTTTGAALATTRALPQYKGLFDGTAVRAPVAAGSIADVTLLTSRDTTADEINEVFREEAATDRYKGVVGISSEYLVSSDVIGDPHAAILDSTMTMVVDNDLAKIMAWYDNEWGYANQMIRQALDMV